MWTCLVVCGKQVHFMVFPSSSLCQSVVSQRTLRKHLTQQHIVFQNSKSKMLNHEAQQVWYPTYTSTLHINAYRTHFFVSCWVSLSLFTFLPLQLCVYVCANINASLSFQSVPLFIGLTSVSDQVKWRSAAHFCTACILCVFKLADEFVKSHCLPVTLVLVY